MSAAILFYLNTKEAVKRILTHGFAEQESHYLSNNPACRYQVQMYYRLMHSRPKPSDEESPLDLLKVTLDLSIDELCRNHELVPCRGKADRNFRIPGHVLNAHAQISSASIGFEGEVHWDEYPSLGVPKGAITKFAEGLNVALLGDPELDLESVPGLLQTCGFNVRPAATVENGDAVLFCVSCAEGPQVSTRKAIAQCSGLKIWPLGILLTQFALVEDESLHELVKAETRDMMTQVLPGEKVDLLPALISGDPYIAYKIYDILSAGREDMICHGIDA